MRTNDPIDMIEKVVVSLGDLADRVVFIGGVTTSLLITDPAAPPISGTKDVDVLVDVGSLHEYTMELGARLRKLGFREDTAEDAPLCRWTMGEIKIDIMPISASVLRLENRWFRRAFEDAVPRAIRDTTIRVASAPCFLAMKLEAFFDRGDGDYVASKDIEDIIAVVDGRAELADDIAAAGDEIRSYLATSLSELLEDLEFRLSISGHLAGDAVRAGELVKRLEAIASRGSP